MLFTPNGWKWKRFQEMQIDCVYVCHEEISGCTVRILLDWSTCLPPPDGALCQCFSSLGAELLFSSQQLCLASHVFSFHIVCWQVGIWLRGKLSESPLLRIAPLFLIPVHTVLCCPVTPCGLWSRIDNLNLDVNWSLNLWWILILMQLLVLFIRPSLESSPTERLYSICDI